MLDLAKILQFIKDGFNQGTATQNDFLEPGTRHRPHVFPEGSNELKVLLVQCFSEPLGEVAFVGKQLAEQSLTEIGHGFTIVNITGSEPQTDQFTPGIDDGVEFESIEPAHRSLAASSAVGKDAMAGDTPVIANGDRGSISNGNPVTLAFEHLEQGCQGSYTAGQEFHTSLIARQLRKLSLQVTAYVNQVETLELAKAQLMKQNGQGHQLRQTQPAAALALLYPCFQKAAF